jgi:hypothetical protein
VIGAVVSLAVLLAGFFLLLPYLGRRTGIPDEFDLKSHIQSGKRQLSQGKFRLARRTFAEAIERRDPAALGASELRELNQLHRQADLFARLLHVPLEEVLRQAQLERDADEWTLRFDDFRGRSVIFDDTVRRDERDRPVLAGYVVESGDQSARVALEDLEILRELPLADETRLIVGGRVSACVREPGGGWVIRFEPDSGVLLTDQGAVTAGFAVPLDEGVKAVLARQQQWLDERAVILPAKK